MQFPIQDHYIDASRHRKATIRSEWTFFCLCSYECNDSEWEIAYEQATKRGLIQNISPGRENCLEKEREKIIILSFLGECMPSPPEIENFAQ